METEQQRAELDGKNLEAQDHVAEGRSRGGQNWKEPRNQRRKIEKSPIMATHDEDVFSGSLAFAEHILREPIPSKDWPQLHHYKYFSDPRGHLTSFLDVMSFYHFSNAVKCRLFLTTLKGLARRSFSSLPEGSINSFEDFASQFISHFSCAKPLFKQTRIEESPAKLIFHAQDFGQSAFAEHILKEPIPLNLKWPRLDYYSGSSDPIEHVIAFVDIISLYNCGEQTRKESSRAVNLKGMIEGSPAKPTFQAQDFRPSAFAEHILKDPIPLKLKWPWLDYYNDSSDPIEHVIAFEDIISLYNFSHGLKCRFFLITLRESAPRRWFSSLPEGSINSFRDFASQFISRFCYAKRILKSPGTLFTIKQRENESLKNYMTRFTRASFEVVDVECEVVRAALTMGIHDGPFKCSLALNPQVTMDDLLNKIQKFIDAGEILFSR